MSKEIATPNYEGMLGDCQKEITLKQKQIYWMYDHLAPWNKRKFDKEFKCPRKRDSVSITFTLPVKIRMV